MTSNPFPRLFEPASLGRLRLKNRLVMLPIGTGYGSAMGEVTQKTIDYYVERARGGVGLIFVGNISVHLPNALNHLVLDSDRLLMGHYELVEKVHDQGVKIAAQLNHQGRQNSAPWAPDDLVSSSPIPTVHLGRTFGTPRALTEPEIQQFAQRFAAAADRAKRAGYDMVEINGGHGYLVNQFMSPFMNKRTDRFGGSLENRMRFPLEIVRLIRQAVGPDFPICFRFSAVEFVPGGVTLEESTTMARMLEAAGVTCLSVSVSIYESITKLIDPISAPETWKAYIWEAVKKAVNVPVVAGGNLRQPETCEKMLEQGVMDFAGLARPLFADPQWPNKAKEGRTDDIRLCISCNECLFGSAVHRRGGGARRCTVNPAAGREGEFARVMPASRPKKVVVIGGGPGGMEAARTAAQRGHKVTLYEKGQALGGQLLMAGKPATKAKLLWLRDYLVTQIEKLGVKVKVGVEATPELIMGLKPDAVVIATGATPCALDISGVNGKNVIGAWDLLQEKVKPKGEKVGVVGGGAAGCDVAEYLLELGNSVVVLEQLPTIAADMEPFNRSAMLEEFNKKSITLLTRRKTVGVTEKGIRATNLDTGHEESIEADRVVIAIGAKPLNTLTASLEGRVPELYSIGDCVQPRVIMEAVYEGSVAGRQV